MNQSNVNTYLIVNFYERTLSRLRNGFFKKIEEKNLFKFNKKIALINNVDDKIKAKKICDSLIESEEIDDAFFVEDVIDEALKAVSLEYKNLGRIPYFSDWAFAAIHLAQDGFLLYWEPEVDLLEPHNWISPGIDFLKKHEEILCVSPIFLETSTKKTVIIDKRLIERKEDNFLWVYGFTDVLFLCEAKKFLNVDYHLWAPASVRYPLSYIHPIFEARIDSYMRVRKKYLGIYMNAVGINAEEMGIMYPKKLFFKEKIKKFIFRQILSILKRIPFNFPQLKI